QKKRKEVKKTIVIVACLIPVFLVIGTLVVTNFSGIFGKAKKSAAKTQLHLVAQQLQYYEQDMGTFPPTELGLSALRVQPTDPVGSGRWAGPYAQKEIPPDPWGNIYQYTLETDPISGEGGFKIWSNGPSGQSNGTEDEGGDDIAVYSYK
ncbi:MAG: type II secretion system protein GspG, partial [Pirellulaceae bacterium]